jgi:hypothetical protein
MTELPAEFKLSNGDSIEVFEEEILYKAESKYRYFIHSSGSAF